MAIRFKNILVYIVYFFIIVFGFHIVKNAYKQQKLNAQITSENKNELTKRSYDTTYTLDSYEPRFVAPRYYDSQFVVYKQPVYTRSFGYRGDRH